MNEDIILQQSTSCEYCGCLILNKNCSLCLSGKIIPNERLFSLKNLNRKQKIFYLINNHTKAIINHRLF